MSDIKITSATHAQTAGLADKTKAQPHAYGAFDASMEAALASINQVRQAPEAQPSAATNVGAVQKDIEANNQLFNEMMKAKQSLSQLYQNIQPKDKT